MQMSSPLKQRYLKANGTMEESKSPLRRGSGSVSKGRGNSPAKSHNPNWRVDEHFANVARNREAAGLDKLRSSPRANSPVVMQTRKAKKKEKHASEFKIS